MKIIGKDRGIELCPAAAARAGIAVTQLTRSESFESQHTYYDICPWSSDERFIVFSSAPIDGKWVPFGCDNLACREGRINVIETENMRIREVARNAVYGRHGGAFCMWHPARYRLYYRVGEGEFAGLDLETGAQTRLPGCIRQISPDGASFATIRQLPGADGQGAAIGVMSENGAEYRELATREQVYELTPNRDQFRIEDITLGNTKWRPDGQYILFTMWLLTRPGVRRSLYIVTRDGSEIRWLTYFGNHHSWTPDGQCVLFNDKMPVGAKGAAEIRMFLVNFDGAERRVVFDKPVGSHPLMHPAGTQVVDMDRKGIYVARLDENRVDRLVDFTRPFDGTHHGTHPHPVWNRDGAQILFNSAESGHSEVYHITMKE